MITKIKSVNSYPELPSENMMRQRFGTTLLDGNPNIFCGAPS